MDKQIDINRLRTYIGKLKRIIDNIPHEPPKMSKGDILRLVTIDEYIQQALLYATNLSKL